MFWFDLKRFLDGFFLKILGFGKLEKKFPEFAKLLAQTFKFEYIPKDPTPKQLTELKEIRKYNKSIHNNYEKFFDKNGIFYYGAPREHFSKDKAISEAKKSGKGYLLMEDLS